MALWVISHIIFILRCPAVVMSSCSVVLGVSEPLLFTIFRFFLLSALHERIPRTCVVLVRPELIAVNLFLLIYVFWEVHYHPSVTKSFLFPVLECLAYIAHPNPIDSHSPPFAFRRI